MTKEPARTIFVVDDDPGQRSLLRSFLTGQGFTVTTASSGREALDALAASQPGMLISDVRMPGMSGLELLGFVAERYPDLPVLLVTAYADIRDAVGAIRGGAVDYLEKPIDLDRSMPSGAVCPSESGPEVSEVSLPEGVIAKSAPMREVLREAARLPRPIAPAHHRQAARARRSSRMSCIAGAPGPRAFYQSKLRRDSGTTPGKRTLRP